VIERQRDQVLGLGARDQHRRGDLQPQRIELAMPDQVGDRDPFAASFDQLAKSLTLRAAGLGVECRVEFDSATIQGVSEEHFGVQPRRVTVTLTEEIGRPLQQSQHGPGILRRGGFRLIAHPSTVPFIHPLFDPPRLPGIDSPCSAYRIPGD